MIKKKAMYAGKDPSRLIDSDHTYFGVGVFSLSWPLIAKEVDINQFINST